MKVTIVTVVMNGFNEIGQCIRSVLSQDYPDIEYIIIDGGSSDGTVSLVKSFGNQVAKFISEPDSGVYDALNKGMKLSTGELIGLLHSDDFLADYKVISSIVNCFKMNDCDVVYGNLNYVDRFDQNKVIRKWRSGKYHKDAIRYGWMPGHGALYVRKKVFDIIGGYSLNFGTCSDYEMMLRIFYVHQLDAVFLDRLIIIMRSGGMSNGSWLKRYLAFIADYKALLANGLPNPLLVLLLKKVRKINQFLN